MSWSASEQRARNWFKPSIKIFLLTIPRRYFFYWSFLLFMSCVCYVFASVHCCFVVTWRERADPLALVCDVSLWLCYFPIWYPGTGVVLDWIDSWFLLAFLLCKYNNCDKGLKVSSIHQIVFNSCCCFFVFCFFFILVVLMLLAPVKKFQSFCDEFRSFWVVPVPNIYSLS